MTKKRLPTSRKATIIFLLSFAASISLAFFGFLSLQMSRGEDPVLKAQVKRPVVYKKIKVTQKLMSPRKTVYTKSASSSESYTQSYTPIQSYSPPAAPVVSSAS